MRIVFLDFDGVLNSEAFMHAAFQARKAGTGITYPSRHTDEICPEMARRVLSVCEQTGASVVISSSWRLLHSLEEIRQMLIEVGVPGLAARVIDRTPFSGFNGEYGRSRGTEIAQWLEMAGSDVEEFVIIDDDSDMLPHQKKNFVQTHWSTGIEPVHVLHAISILEGA